LEQIVFMDYVAHYTGPSKIPQTVQEHVQETAELAGSFASKIGISEAGKLAGLLHDLGKYSLHFQRYIRSAEGVADPDAEPVNVSELKGRIDHSSAGAQLAWDTLGSRDSLSRIVAQLVALCVASHHTGLIDCLAPDGEDKYSVRLAKDRKQTYFDEALGSADREVLAQIDVLFNKPSVADDLRTTLLRVFAGEDSRLIREFSVGLVTRFLFSALVDADRLSAAGRTKIAPSPDWNTLIDRLENHLTGIQCRNWVDDIRAEVSQSCHDFADREKGLYQLTVPTGGAKTLSSLRFGLHHASRHRMDRLIYVIPYTSIIDQNAEVARVALENGVVPPGSIVLEHHSNLTPEKAAWQTNLLAENWDAPVIFTTTVQFLEALFSGGTRGVRRMHNLANAVIIFDEIQTLPLRTIHLFNNAANFLVKLCGTTVVFCTATQPLLHRVSHEKGAVRLSINPEMAPRPAELFMKLKRVEIIDKRKTGGWVDVEIAQCVCDLARESGTALAVVNTKAAAKDIYALCKQQLGTENTIHLSTNMCPAHRLKVIEDMKKRLDSQVQPGKPLACISTQLIEAGVDVDFGSVVRFLAGLDSIAQAAGRCNRNGRRDTGKVLVINPADESLDKLREIRIGKEITERVLDEYRANPEVFDNNLLSPKALERYYRYYFVDRAHEMAYHVTTRETGLDTDLLSLLSHNDLALQANARGHANSSPTYSLRQSFRSAGEIFQVIDGPTEGIIVQYGQEGREIVGRLCASKDPEEIRRLLRRAQRFSVNLYPGFRVQLGQSGCIYETQTGSGIFYLDECYYNAEFGVSLKASASADFLGV
jgi:CRISPR-associated endonuclease/helicase Cas3